MRSFGFFGECSPDELEYLRIVGIVSCYQTKEVIFGILLSHPS